MSARGFLGAFGGLISTVDEDLLADVDAAAAAHGYNRSGFVAEATRRLIHGDFAPRTDRAHAMADPRPARATRPKTTSSKEVPLKPAGVKFASGKVTDPKPKPKRGSSRVSQPSKPHSVRRAKSNGAKGKR